MSRRTRPRSWKVRSSSRLSSAIPADRVHHDIAATVHYTVAAADSKDAVLALIKVSSGPTPAFLRAKRRCCRAPARAIKFKFRIIKDSLKAVVRSILLCNRTTSEEDVRCMFSAEPVLPLIFPK